MRFILAAKNNTVDMYCMPVAIVGHRGARGEAPENTLASFQLAIDAGVPEIELDVRLSSDGHLIVLHDKDVDRTTSLRGGAQKYTLAELAVMDARRNTPGWHRTTPIPALSEVVDMCPPDMRFQFEVKRAARDVMHQKAARIKKLIDERDLYERVVVTSSSGTFLRMMRTTSDRVQLGYVCQYRYLQPLRRADALRCDWVILHHSLATESIIRRAHRRRMGVSVWTVNDLPTAEKLLDLGVDSIITDYPSAFMTHFAQRAMRSSMAAQESP